MIIFIVATMLGTFSLGVLYGENDLKAQAIERGYGEYCAKTGYWSWIGECEEIED